MNDPTIVLTRPAAQAEPLAQRLTALGYSVAQFPLLVIKPLSEDGEWYAHLQTTLTHLSRYALAVFVSVNAIHEVFKHGLTWPSEVAIAVMGESSQAALAHYGVTQANNRIYCPTDSCRSDSEALLQLLDLPALKGHEVVIFRAETGRELLSDALAANGIQVNKVVSYSRFIPEVTKANKSLLLTLLTTSCIWVVSSSEALRALAKMIKQHADMIYFSYINLWVSHPRIAEVGEKCGFKHIQMIGSGDEKLLLALQSWSVKM